MSNDRFPWLDQLDGLTPVQQADYVFWNIRGHGVDRIAHSEDPRAEAWMNTPGVPAAINVLAWQRNSKGTKLP